ncbi:MAG TPA: M20/M25/M40 family metallo-hydrolase, partial [Candidatus Obscuribacterales bacterium]
DSATNKLSRALNRIAMLYPKQISSPQAVHELSKIAATRPEPLKTYYTGVVSEMKSPEYIKSIAGDRMLSSMLVNTVSITVLKAGYKTNVIPGEAVAELDCRLLPGVDKDEFIAEIKRAIHDPTIEISVLEWNTPGVSPLETDLFKAIQAVAKEEAPGVAVKPVVVPWFTDSHWFRCLGITCYGFEPVEVKPDLLASMHGKDERIPLTVFSDGLRRLYKIIARLTTA